MSSRLKQAFEQAHICALEWHESAQKKGMPWISYVRLQGWRSCRIIPLGPPCQRYLRIFPPGPASGREMNKAAYHKYLMLLPIA
jgi:hypothetical protein